MAVVVVVARCAEGKWVVGKLRKKSSCVSVSLVQDIGGEWTSKYAVEEIVEVHRDVSHNTFNSILWKTMKARGWENVRGGSRPDSPYMNPGLTYCPFDEQGNLLGKHMVKVGQGSFGIVTLELGVRAGRVFAEGRARKKLYANLDPDLPRDMVLECVGCPPSPYVVQRLGFKLHVGKPPVITMENGGQHTIESYARSLSEQDRIKVLPHLFQKMLWGVRAFELCGLINMDIKPSNIMVDTRGDSIQVKFVDIGVMAVQTRYDCHFDEGTYLFWSRECLESSAATPENMLWSIAMVAAAFLANRPTGYSQECLRVYNKERGARSNALQIIKAASKIPTSAFSNIPRRIRNELKEKHPALYEILWECLSFRPAFRPTIEQLVCHPIWGKIEPPLWRNDCGEVGPWKKQTLLPMRKEVLRWTYDGMLRLCGEEGTKPCIATAALISDRYMASVTIDVLKEYVLVVIASFYLAQRLCGINSRICIGQTRYPKEHTPMEILKVAIRIMERLKTACRCRTFDVDFNVSTKEVMDAICACPPPYTNSVLEKLLSH